MFLEVACPVRREPAWTTAGAQLQRAFQMREFDPESRERSERIDDRPTAVTSDVIALVGILLRLDRTVGTDRVGDSFILPSGVRLASLGTGRSVAERTANERFLHHSPITRTALSYYVETKQWDAQYVEQLRQQYLVD